LNAVARFSASTSRSMPKQCDLAGGSKSTPATARATESTYIGGVAFAPTIPRCPLHLLRRRHRRHGRVPRTVRPSADRPPGRRTGQPPPGAGAGVPPPPPLRHPLPSSPPRPPPARPLPLLHPLRSRCRRRRRRQRRRGRCVGDQNLGSNSYVCSYCFYVGKVGSMLTSTLIANKLVVANK
jgi:hypothetical protein